MEIYVSTDCETDGPIPGMNSMLSFGSAAYSADKKLLATFEANLELLPGAAPNPATMEWWKTQPEAWAACRENQQQPEAAMKKYLAWLKALPGKPVFVAYPVAFDFMFVYWYLVRFAGESPFSHSGLDIKTLAMALLKTGYRESTKNKMPARWFDPLPHTHRALDDAIEQGALFCNMLAELRPTPKPTLERAIVIAVEAHAGQQDKAGNPYILHPLRVMQRVTTEEERIAAILHDVVEDTTVTMDDLRNDGFSQPVLTAVAALTKLPGESRMQAAARAVADPIARVVKLADNAENMDMSRIPNPTEKDHARLKEYAQVRALLLGETAPHAGGKT
jgi:hypothetical protein